MVPAAEQTGLSRPLVEALINPATVYAAPADVLADPALTPLQQRAALLAWARDALSLETAAADALEDLEVPSRIDDVIDALAALDPAAAAEYRRHSLSARGRGRPSAGASLIGRKNLR